MASQNGILPAVWDDFDRCEPHTFKAFLRIAANHAWIYRQLGQLFMVGFDGTSVNDQIKALIETYHCGNILLTTKNLKCVKVNERFENRLLIDD